MKEAETSYHYRVIARAIDLIASDAGRHARLEDLASALGMSPAHFQRLFSKWAGVSPKRFQQYLMLDQARELLAAGESLAESAHRLGLSGTSRLHDLFLRWEAMTPGEFATGGAGLVLEFGWFETPFGLALAASSPRGLSALFFVEPGGCSAALDALKRRWPKAQLREKASGPAPHVAAAFAQSGRLDLHIIGTPFQIQVWEALLSVPSGATTSYSALGAQIGMPSAARAIGSAVGRNPIGFAIPCHRVLRRDGGLGGYHWGETRKRAMLGWEAARRDAAQDAAPPINRTLHDPTLTSG